MATLFYFQFSKTYLHTKPIIIHYYMIYSSVNTDRTRSSIILDFSSYLYYLIYQFLVLNQNLGQNVFRDQYILIYYYKGTFIFDHTIVDLFAFFKGTLVNIIISVWIYWVFTIQTQQNQIIYENKLFCNLTFFMNILIWRPKP